MPFVPHRYRPQALSPRKIRMRFTKDHEWVEVDGDVATVGITAYAAEQLGDVVFVETARPWARRVESRRRPGRGRERQGRLGRLRAGLRRGGRGQRRLPDDARDGQRSQPERRRLVRQDQALTRRSRRPDGRRVRAFLDL